MGEIAAPRANSRRCCHSGFRTFSRASALISFLCHRFNVASLMFFWTGIHGQKTDKSVR